MPDNTPAARQEKLSALGAQLLFSPAREGAAGARALARTWAEKRGWYYTDWLACDDNPEYHRRVTGPAIAEAIVREGQSLVDTVTVGVGSGGTITGVGECVKAWTNDVRMVAVEPYECQALSGGLLGPHNIQDMGFGLVPDNYNPYVVDKIAAVASADALRAARTVLLTDAIPASASGGAALAAAARFLAEGRSRAALCLIPEERPSWNRLESKEVFCMTPQHDQRPHHPVAGKIHHPPGAGQPVPADLQRRRQRHRGALCGRGRPGRRGHLQPPDDPGHPVHQRDVPGGRASWSAPPLAPGTATGWKSRSPPPPSRGRPFRWGFPFCASCWRARCCA